MSGSNSCICELILFELESVKSDCSILQSNLNDRTRFQDSQQEHINHEPGSMNPYKNCDEVKS